MHAIFFKTQRVENEALFQLQGLFFWLQLYKHCGELRWFEFFQMNNESLKSVSAMQSTS